MYISKIRIKNFKTFDGLIIDLNEFDVLIGACGSGKTNFMEVFEFIRDVSQDFHSAIKEHGGEYIKNLNLNDNNEESCIGVTLSNSNESDNSLFEINEDISLCFTQVDYEICFKFIKDGCRVFNETVEISFCENHDENKIIIRNNDGEINAEFLNDSPNLHIDDIIPPVLLNIVSKNFIKDNIPIINSTLSTIPLNWIKSFKSIASYDFNPMYCKDLNYHGSGQKLTKNGGNIPSVLKNILKDDKKKKELLSYYTNLLPYIKDVSVEKILGEERIFMIEERYNNVKIPAPYISDGTSTIMAMLIALYFQDENIVLIEEPEKFIHPSLIAKLMLIMESVEDKQVIITTHSPEILKYSELENIYFISRNDKGISQIKKIIDNDVVKPFIDELGVDSVFINDYLGLE